MIKKYADLIEMLEKIFGKGAVSRTIGTRTNVVRFPKGKQPIDPTRGNFDVEGTAVKNPDLVQTIENSIEDRMGDITKMNDQELLTYTANVRRLLNFKEPPIQNADVVKFGSGEEIKGEGLEKLIQKQGIKNPPTTAAGQLETTGKRLEQLGEDFAREFDVENIAKQEAERQAMIARQYEGKGYAGGVFGPSGMYRAVARDFLLDQHAKGKIKLDADTLRNLEERNYISGGQPLMYADPIRIMRYHYGDDVFEKIPLDKIPTGARSEIIDVMSKVEAPPIRTEPPKTPGGYLTPGEYRANIEELQGIENAIKRRESRFANMTEEEIENELAQYGGKRSSFEMGLEFDYPEEYAKYKKPQTPESKSEVLNIQKEATKRTSIDDLIDEYNANQDRLRLSDEEGGTAIGYEEFQKIQKRNEDIAKALEEKGISSKVEEKPEAEIIPFKKKNLEPEEKADGGRIGYSKGKRVKSSIDKLLEKLNKKLSNKESMESVNPKTGEVTIPKKPIRRAEEPTGTTVMDAEPETIDERAITKTQQKTKVKKYDEDIIKAANEIYPSYDDPKIAADQIVDSYAQMKFGLEDQYGLSDKQRMDLYGQAYDYVMDYNRGAIGKTAGESINISDEATAKAFTDFAKENDPEGFKKIQKIVDDINNQNVLENFNPEAEMIKQKYGNVIDDNLLQQILVDDNPQRKAEVMATIDEALKMQERGMGPEQIMDIIKNTTRTKQAEGGIAGLL